VRHDLAALWAGGARTRDHGLPHIGLRLLLVCRCAPIELAISNPSGENRANPVGSRSFGTQVSVGDRYVCDLLSGFLIIGVGIALSFVAISISALAGCKAPRRDWHRA
jgi:hypothetical protein